MQESSFGGEGAGDEENLSFMKRMQLGLSKQYYSYADTLGFKKLQDYLQTRSTMVPRRQAVRWHKICKGARVLPSSGVIWLIGERYDLAKGADKQVDNDKVMTQILSDFSSRLWMTYRQGFTPIGSQQLTTDAGWGCTLRSGQMLLAQVLLHHTCGRQWRRADQEVQDHSDVAHILALFWDGTGAQHPFSVHNLVAAGRQYGIVAGDWLGPWTLCHALAKIANSVHPSGLRIHLATTPGGGAPVLYTACVESLFKEEDEPGQDASRSALESPCSVLLLIPLVLGIGKVNPRYVPQLKSVLEWPQSAGIVGGRPSSSTYFIGHQGDSIIFLDPHTLQECGSSPRAVKETYFCSTARAMPVDSIDPSLAIGFYCRNIDSFKDLAQRLAGLETQAGGAPLINIVEGRMPEAYAGSGRQSSMDPSGQRGDDPWELL